MRKTEDFKVTIFDLDGTLFDSMGIWKKIDIDFFKKYNLNVSKSYFDIVSNLTFEETAKYTINLFQLNKSVNEMIAEWNQMAMYEYGNIKIKPHAKKYIKFLKINNIKVVVVTSLTKILYEPLLINNNIYELFDYIVSTSDIGHDKEFIYKIILQKFNIISQECLVFEDLLSTIKTVKKLNMKAYGVYDKYSSKDKNEIVKIADGYLTYFNEAPTPKITH
jgi:HAD superfamily hydrolase (TIGR01509 family)